MSAMPATKPPMWANQATPPPLESLRAELSSCKTNQNPNTHKAGNRISCEKNPSGISTNTRA